MGQQAFRAGPGTPRSVWDGREPAVQASPRLLIEEVSFNLGTHGLGARVTLSLGPRRFVGRGAGRGEEKWQLAAAATVDAIQEYLQHSHAAPSVPQVKLIATAATATAFGPEVIHVIVGVRRDDRSTHLLGSALVRNDRCSTAVAAALDATSRHVGSYHVADSGVPSVPRRVRSGRAPAPLVTELPPPQLRFASGVASLPNALVLGLAVTPGAAHAVAVEAEGKIAAQVRRPFCPSDPEAAAAAMAEAAHEATSQLGPSAASGIGAAGVAAPGTALPGEGDGAADNGWSEMPLRASLAEMLALPVEVIGTVPAAALAEVEFGSARGLSEVLYLRVALDIQAAVIAGGVPVPTIGEMSHVTVDPKGPRCECGGTGCWKTVGASSTLVSRVTEALESGAKSTLTGAGAASLTPALVCKAAAAGDRVAKEALAETGRCLADGLGTMVTMFNPEAVVLDSDSPAVAAALRRAVEASLKTSARASAFARCVLLSPELGELAPALGAAAWAARKLRDL